MKTYKQLEIITAIGMAALHATMATVLNTSLLIRQQEQTLPDATLPIDKTHRFSKIAVNF